MGLPPTWVGSCRNGESDTHSDKILWSRLEEIHCRRNRRGPMGGTFSDDMGCIAIWRGGPRIEDTTSQCSNFGNQSNSGCSLGSRWQRPAMSWLPRLFKVKSNSVVRLDCSIPHSNSTEACHCTPKTVEDAVRIQPSDGRRLGTELATCLGGWNDKAERPTSIFTTPGSSYWAPRPSCHHGIQDTRDWTIELQVLSVLCWVWSHCCRSWLESFCPMECPSDGAGWRNERQLHILRHAWWPPRICDSLPEAARLDPLTTSRDSCTE